jgi:hypothetical protein
LLLAYLLAPLFALDWIVAAEMDWPAIRFFGTWTRKTELE